MKIAIIGTGLIGGSLALSLRGFQTEIIGVDKNPTHAHEAVELGIVDKAMSLEDALQIANLVILAIPVNSAQTLLPFILDNIPDSTVVVDVGSTKKNLCHTVENHPKRKNFVASHPIAGTENSGPKAAIANLFDNKMTIICEKEKSADFALDMVEKMYKILNMRVHYMDPDSHDLHIAYVSHISHITSFTLGLTVLEIEKDEKQIFTMAGSGFASTARLAKSSPEMWAPIFDQNAENISQALSIYIDNLQKFKKLIDDHDLDALRTLMYEANKIRRVLEGIATPK